MSTSTLGCARRSFISGSSDVAAGEELGLVAVLAEQRDGLVGRVGADVVERRRGSRRRSAASRRAASTACTMLW